VPKVVSIVGVVHPVHRHRHTTAPSISLASDHAKVATASSFRKLPARLRVRFRRSRGWNFSRRVGTRCARGMEVRKAKALSRPVLARPSRHRRVQIGAMQEWSGTKKVGPSLRAPRVTVLRSALGRILSRLTGSHRCGFVWFGGLGVGFGHQQPGPPRFPPCGALGRFRFPFLAEPSRHRCIRIGATQEGPPLGLDQQRSRRDRIALHLGRILPLHVSPQNRSPWVAFVWHLSVERRDDRSRPWGRKSR
jgi:hypothetical protein